MFHSKIIQFTFCVFIGLQLMACAQALPGDAVVGGGTASGLSLEDDLRADLQRQGVTGLPAFTSSESLLRLGEALFKDKRLSGDQDISCSTCHDVNFATGDGLPFSIGTGGVGSGTDRHQNGIAGLTKRNAPNLFNLDFDQESVFFDGRVSFNRGVLQTPVDALNGTNPLLVNVVNEFESAVHAQGLFPIVNELEMLGTNNDLADAGDEAAIWDALIQDRLLQDDDLLSLFQDAYPSVAIGDIHVGHLGKALGEFMLSEFRADQTPFDEFLSGNNNALSAAQKRGLRVFLGRGRCIQCHSGSMLTSNNFEGVGVPQIGTAPFEDDEGRFDVTGRQDDLYRFKVPGLRNIALTAPYMHDGVFQNLREVVDHYNNIEQSLDRYRLPTSYQRFYESDLTLDTNDTRNQRRLNQVSDDRLRRGLRLSEQERNDLLDFLQNALTDPRWLQD